MRLRLGRRGAVEDLSVPRAGDRFGSYYDPEGFGRFSERIAHTIGTAKFLVIQTVFVVWWVLWNILAPEGWRIDAFPFILLNLAFSTQAAYAAPLILLAQNRQDDRDRVQIEQDRQRAERNLADTEYLAREVVALRLAMRDVATKDFIRAELRALLEELEAEVDKK